MSLISSSLKKDLNQKFLNFFRPLPIELIKYAQQDTHYLLYIFDKMVNELLHQANGQTNLLKSVYQSSKEVCLKRYAKPLFTDDSYMDLYRKSKR